MPLRNPYYEYVDFYLIKFYSSPAGQRYTVYSDTEGMIGPWSRDMRQQIGVYTVPIEPTFTESRVYE